MALTIQSAKSPEYITADRLHIRLKVKFDQMPDEIDFVATPNDPEKHGAYLFEQAVSGAYGDVHPYVAPAEVPNAN